jgi:pimeloyl-ACP methyl ester carboxylesterase
MTRMTPARLAGGALGALALAATVIAARAARGELASIAPTRHAVPRLTGEAWLGAAKDFSLQMSKGIVLRGWLLDSANGAAVLLVHGSRTDRTQLLPEARILSGAGYGVLMFDLPGDGESGGQKRRGNEEDSLRLAIEMLASEPGIHSGGIGAYGFSTGAAFLAEVAARDARLRGVVLAGCYTDADESLRRDFGQWGPLSALPALWTARWAGVVTLHPLASVPAIGPRAVFFITGDADRTVPPGSSERLYSVASEPKELWIVHGAVHGGYAQVAGEEYARRLVAFFDRSLLGRNGSR